MTTLEVQPGKMNPAAGAHNILAGVLRNSAPMEEKTDVSKVPEITSGMTTENNIIPTSRIQITSRIASFVVSTSEAEHR